jgi:hypothetical protein
MNVKRNESHKRIVQKCVQLFDMIADLQQLFADTRTG